MRVVTRILLVGNPTARSGDAQARIARARAALAARGATVELQPTAALGRTVERVRDALARGAFDAAVALGGDGTFAEVARGVLAAGAPCPLGFLPSGTANNQGRSFGLEASAAALERNVEVVLAGHVAPIDVGRLEDLDRRGAEPVLFFDSVGFGLQADILAVRNRDRDTVGQIPLLRDLYRGELVYAGAALDRYLASWAKPTKFSAEVVTADGVHHFSRLTDLIVSATPVYAGRWVLDRAARADDGRFELIPIQGRRDWLVKAVRDLAPLSTLGEHFDALGIPRGPVVSADGFELRLRRPSQPGIPSQVDGEEWTPARHLRVTVLPGRLPLIVPAGFVPPWQA